MMRRTMQTPFQGAAGIALACILLMASRSHRKYSQAHPQARAPRALHVVQPSEARETHPEPWIASVAAELMRPIEAALQSVGRLPSHHRGEIAKEEVFEIQRIEAMLRSLARMSRDLEQYSRIDSEHLELHRREADLRPLMREALRAVSHAIVGRQMEVIEEGPQKAIYADPARVTQVLTNLLTNAAEYGTPGTPIRIEAVYADDEVTISISNEGPGIPKDSLAQLFETRLARVSPHTARAGALPGLGIGLFVTRGIVEALGGRIWVESELGKETTFLFTLPLRKE